MVALETPAINKNMLAIDFNLSGIDGKKYTLETMRGKNGILVIFMCNHCPYVKAIIKKLVEDVKKLNAVGIGVIGINANDVANYPEDSFENMKLFAKEHEIIFPYVFDETQNIARSYGAICTPDFFGFNNQLLLRYRGRFDSSGKSDNPNANRELLSAMTEVASIGDFSGVQYPSIGCSIKWRN